jgi:hypothetical protein
MKVARYEVPGGAIVGWSVPEGRNESSPVRSAGGRNSRVVRPGGTIEWSGLALQLVHPRA